MFEERVALAGGFILEMTIPDDLDFVLLLRKGSAVLVEYRRPGGYEFKSVEKLRYDFQRDVENALRQG